MGGVAVGTGRERDRLLGVGSYLRLLHTVAFGRWSDLPEPETRRGKLILGFKSMVLSVAGVALCGAVAELGLGSFDWPQAGVGLFLGIALGVAVGLVLGVTVGVPVGMALSVALSVGGGMVGGALVGVLVGVVGGAAGGLALGSALGVAGGLTVGLAGGVSFWTYERLQGLTESPIGILFGVGGAMAVAALGFVSAWLVAAPVGFAASLWKPRRLLQEWMAVGLFVGASSLGAGVLLASAARGLGLDETSPLVLAGVFVLVYTRLPLWPFEALWGSVGCWWLLERSSTTDGARLAKGIRQLFFDRQMILPLPCEAKSLRRLAELDEDLAVREAAELARASNHRLVAILLLRFLASRNPLAVHAQMSLDPDGDNRHRNLDFVSHRLSDGARRLWRAEGRLLELSTRILRSGAPGSEEEEGEPQSSATPGSVAGLSAATETLRLVVNDLDAACVGAAPVRHTESQLDLYRGLLRALEAESVDGVRALANLPAQVADPFSVELREAVDRLRGIAARIGRGHGGSSLAARDRMLGEAQDDLAEMALSVQTVPRPAGPLLALTVAHWGRLVAVARGS